MSQLVKNTPAMRGTWVQSLGWEDPLEKGKATNPVLWPGEFHGLYKPWGCKELDMTDWLSLLLIIKELIREMRRGKDWTTHFLILAFTHLYRKDLKGNIFPINTVGFPVALLVENLPANSGDPRDSGLIPGSGRSPRGGNGTLLKYSCQENRMNRRGWRATVHGVTKSRTRLNIWAHQYSIVCQQIDLVSLVIEK